jgi:hypothetical protein
MQLIEILASTSLVNPHPTQKVESIGSTTDARSLKDGAVHIHAFNTKPHPDRLAHDNAFNMDFNTGKGTLYPLSPLRECYTAILPF